MTDDLTLARAEWRSLQRLRRCALMEGTTLLLLLAIAVPLKHLAHLPLAVSVMGPVHGLAFLAYLWALLESHGTRPWAGRELGLLLAGAVLPLGGFFSARFLRHKAAELGWNRGITP